jgi:acetylornithine deacetylase
MTSPYAADTVRILSSLIGFSTTFEDSNLDLIDWITQELHAQGIEARLIYDADKRKANLFATIGPPSDGGIILSGHTDVVSVRTQDWSTDPFKASLSASRIYGRGACDMKGFIASVLAHIPRWKDLPLQRPLHLAFTYDEEVDCAGVQRLLAELETTKFRAAACIVGEPTGMECVVAHKGRLCCTCTVRGKAVHSSQAPSGINAIEFAARLIVYIQKLAHQESKTGLRDRGFDVPFSTMATTMVSGGVAANTVPNHCSFSLDCRHLPSVDPSRILAQAMAFKDQLVDEMQRADPQGNIDLLNEVTTPPFISAVAEPLASLLQSLAASPRRKKAAFTSEAGYFERAHIPTVVCGPGHVEQAHRADEYIALSELDNCSRFLSGLMNWMCLRPD